MHLTGIHLPFDDVWASRVVVTQVEMFRVHRIDCNFSMPRVGKMVAVHTVLVAIVAAMVAVEVVVEVAAKRATMMAVLLPHPPVA